MKRQDLDAYSAGRRAVLAKKWDWKTVVIVAAAVFISDFVERWLSHYYSIAQLERYAFSFLLLLLVIVGLTALRGKLRI